MKEKETNGAATRGKETKKRAATEEEKKRVNTEEEKKKQQLEEEKKRNTRRTKSKNPNLKKLNRTKLLRSVFNTHY